MIYCLGVDPGWVKCGVAVLSTEDGEKFNLEKSLVLKPRDLGLRNVAAALDLAPDPYYSIGIERFVSYRGKFSSASEDILMLIGALRVQLKPDAHMFRAIDWKNYLLHKFNLKTNAGKLDKVFSFDAAAAICNKKPKTDHEADAICIAYCAYRATATLGTSETKLA